MLIYQECANAQAWKEIEVLSSSGGSYVVTIPPWGVKHAVCECRGYTFRGRCRHLAEAAMASCQWSSLDGVEQTADQSNRKVCPECGGATKIVAVEE